jgi:hypothetical protein
VQRKKVRSVFDVAMGVSWSHPMCNFMNKEITNVGQSDVNLGMLVLPCSRIFLVQGGFYCLLSRWAGVWLPTYLASFVSIK